MSSQAPSPTVASDPDPSTETRSHGDLEEQSNPEPTNTTSSPVKDVAQGTTPNATSVASKGPVSVTVKLSAMEQLLCGAAAGAVGKTVVAPVDRVKLLYMVNSEKRFSLSKGLKTFRVISKNTGTSGLWKGNGSAMWRVLPYSAVSFTCYDRYHNFLKRVLHTNDSRRQSTDPTSQSLLSNAVLARFLAGAGAGATATFVTYPFDLLRARAAAHWSKEALYTTPLKGLAQIYRQEGLRGWFKGIVPTMYGIIPYGGLSFGIFESLKASWIKYITSVPRPRALTDDEYRALSYLGRVQYVINGWAHDLQDSAHPRTPANASSGSNQSSESGETASKHAPSVRLKNEQSEQARIPAAVRLAAGGIAGIIATTAVQPLQLIRRRMQVDTTTNGTPKYRSTWHAFKEIYRHEGIRGGLFKGLLLTWLKSPISLAISFTVNDALKHGLVQAHVSALNEWMQERSEQRQQENAEAVAIGYTQLLSEGGVIVNLDETLRAAHKPVDIAAPPTTAFSTNDVEPVPTLAPIIPPAPGYTSPTSTPGTVAVDSSRASLGSRIRSWFSLKPTITAHVPADSVQDGEIPPPRALDDQAGLYARALSKLTGGSVQNRGQESHQPHAVKEDITAHGQARLTAEALLISGGIAGACAKTVIAPADNIKILYQVKPDMKFNFRNAFQTGRDIVQSQGPLGLWRGHGATLMRVIPYASITFLTYDRYIEAVTSILHGGLPSSETTGSSGEKHGTSKGPHDTLARFVAGGLAGATSTAITYPLDLMRARQAAQINAPRYSSYFSGTREIIRTEGVHALWNGLRPTLVGIVPYAGFSFSIFHTLKAQLRTTLQLDTDAQIPTHLRLAAGAIAGLCAQSLTYPLDIVRRRNQVGAMQTMSTIRSISHIFSSEGFRGLFRGLSMNWVKGPIASAVSFTVNDRIKYYMSQSSWFTSH